jgi:hypothetical protein
MNGLVFFGVPLSFENNVKLRHQIQMLFFPTVLFILTIFIGLRLSSPDYDNYSAWFDSVASGNLVAQGFANDPAFILVSYVVSALGLSLISVIVFFAAAALASQFYFSKIASGQKWVTFLFYLVFCRTFAGSDMASIRSAVAIPLMSISILLAFRGKRKIALLLFIVSAAFHLSALIGLLPFILAILNVPLNSRWWILSFAPATIVARILLQEIILFMSNATRTSAYAIGLMAGTDPPRAYIAYIAVRILLLALMTILLWNRITSESRLVLFCFAFGIMIQIVFISNNAVSSRGSDIFSLFDLVALMIPLKFLKDRFCLLYAAGLVVLELALFQFSLKDLQPYHWIFA